MRDSEISAITAVERERKLPGYSSSFLTNDLSHISISASDGNYRPKSHKASINTTRQWRAGMVRFPWCSASLLLLIILMFIGIGGVLEASKGKDYDSWNGWHYYGLTVPPGEKWYKVKPHKVEFILSVNVLLSAFASISGKLLGFAFAEAFTVYWWRQIMKGKSIKRLHYDYEYRSIEAILRNPRFFNFLCTCVIAYTLFGAVGPILQKASETAVSSEIDHPPKFMNQSRYFPSDMRSLEVTLPRTFPDGGSAVNGIDDKSRSTSDLTEATAIAFEPFASTKFNIYMPVNGCHPITTHRPAQSCGGFFENIGFDFSCTTGTSSFARPGFINQLFGVQFYYNNDIPGIITLSVTYKNEAGCRGAINTINCTLKPAMIRQFIWFHMVNTQSGGEDMKALDDFGATFLPDRYQQLVAESRVTPSDDKDLNATTRLARAELAGAELDVAEPTGPNNRSLYQAFSEFASLDGTTTEIWADQVNSLISFQKTPKDRPNDTTIEYLDSAEKTIGGLARIFSNTLSSTYLMTWNSSLQTDALTTTGSYWTDYIDQSDIVLYCNTTFQNPLQGTIDSVRELMFRYSALVPYFRPYNVPDWIGDEVVDSWNPRNESYVKLKRSEGPNSDRSYSIREIYQTNYLPFYICGGLTLAGILATCFLFWGFWHIGRKVTLSPFEMARALHLPHRPDIMRIHPNEGSNFEFKELMEHYGKMKVQYGEIAPGLLGLGLVNEVTHPRPGEHYR